MEGLMNQMRREASQQLARLATARYGLISSYDPDTHAVQVRVQPEDVISGWIPLGSIYVGNGWGLVVGPAIGDQVLVEFGEGDYESGVIIGRMFSDQARPPAAPSGEFWLVHETQSLLKFKNDGGVELVTNADLVATVGANAQVTVQGDLTGNINGSANLTVQSDVNAQVGGDASIDVGGDAGISAGSEITMSAPLITLTGEVSVIGNLGVAGNISFTTGHNLTGHGNITTTGNVSDGAGSMAAMRGNYNAHTHTDPQGGTVGPPNPTM